LPEIEILLKRYDLPASDCIFHLENFVVAIHDGKLVGVGGFESCSGYGLLRSFAVSPKFKGQGIAEHIFETVYSNALRQEKTSLYLLTTTAASYFEKFGFSKCDRSSCPESIKRTKQFSEFCPESAITMELTL